MAVLVDRNTKVICQGFTAPRALSIPSRRRLTAPRGRRRHPGKGETTSTCRCSTPWPMRLKDLGECLAIYAAAVCWMRSWKPSMPRWTDRRITEGIPVLDMLRVKRVWPIQNRASSGPTARHHHARGVQIGIMPGHIHASGKIMVSRSGTLTTRWWRRPRPLAWARPPASGSAATRSTAPTSSTARSSSSPIPDRGHHHDRRNGGSAEEDAGIFKASPRSRNPSVVSSPRTAPPGRRMAMPPPSPAARVAPTTRSRN